MKTGVLGASQSLPSQERLLRYLKGGRVHPAILLSGEDKVTKWQVAKGMAKYLLCQSPKESFCGQCSSCRRIEKDLHPDVLLVPVDEDEPLKVDTIREISHQMLILPIEGRSKICIVDECHRMNQASANAFLKTLEEPGRDRYYVLLSTQPGSLLPTILSRCVQFSVKSDADLTEISAEEQMKFQELLAKALGEKAFDVVSTACDDKESCLRFLQFLQRELHKVAFRSETQMAPIPLFRDLDADTVLRRYEAVLALEGRLRSNANCGLMLEGLLREHFVGR